MPKALRALLPTVVYLCLAALVMLNHEMWRDEFQAWLIAQASHSIPDLVHNLRYEGHPLLWYAILWLFVNTFHTITAMQVFHLLVAAMAVWVLFRYSPLPFVMKALLAGGYFMLFEYAVISRSYSLGVLLFFAFIALYRQFPKGRGWIALVLFLLGNTSIYGLILAFTCCLLMGADAIIKKNHTLKTTMLPGLVALAGALLAVFTMRTAPDAWYYTDKYNAFAPDNLTGNLDGIFMAFYPMTDTLEWYIPGQASLHAIMAIVALAILFFTGWMLRRDRPLLLIYISGMFLLLILHSYTGLQYFRHVGHYFIFWAGCLWLGAQRGIHYRKPEIIMQYAVMGVGVACTIAAIQMELGRPFSNSEKAAKFLQREGYDDAVITGFPDYTITPFSALLHKPVYYLERKEMGTFVKWDTIRHNGELRQDYLPVLINLVNNTPGDVILMTKNPLTKRVNGRREALPDFFLTQGIHVTWLAQFTGAYIADENYIIYKLKKE
jgi:hypothetical protein